MSTARLGTIPVSPPAIAPGPLHLGYRPSLDGLRAFAVLVVMAHHAYIPFFGGGAVGVDLFFALSGFLITSLLLEEWQKTGRISLKNFYIRRVLRLFPALVVFLAFIQLYSLTVLRGIRLWEMEKAIAAVVFYVGNWVRAFGLVETGVLSHTWSLSIEEQFYLLWPLALLLLLRANKNERWIFRALAVVIVFIAVRRGFMWDGISSAERIYNGSDTRFDELLAGCACAILPRIETFPLERARGILRYLVPAALCLIFAVIVHPISLRAMYTLGWPAMELAAGIVILGLMLGTAGPLQKVLEIRPAVWIGRLSYGLYLWHFPIISRAGGWDALGVFKIPAGFALTFVAAGTSYYVVESGFLKLKRYFSVEESSNRDRRGPSSVHGGRITTTGGLVSIRTLAGAVSAWLASAPWRGGAVVSPSMATQPSSSPGVVQTQPVLELSSEAPEQLLEQPPRRPPRQSSGTVEPESVRAGNKA
jgi:peptidoglycan/LPS O-acetylase OafA/YrhL